jgi:hypothetical protein
MQWWGGISAGITPRHGTVSLLSNKRHRPQQLPNGAEHLILQHPYTPLVLEVPQNDMSRTHDCLHEWVLWCTKYRFTSCLSEVYAVNQRSQLKLDEPISFMSTLDAR